MKIVNVLFQKNRWDETLLKFCDTLESFLNLKYIFTKWDPAYSIVKSNTLGCRFPVFDGLN